MKNIELRLSKASWILALLLMTSAGSRSQTYNSGLYMSLTDYQDHRLTYQIDCTKETLEEIELSDFALTIFHDGISTTYQKSDVFGFKDCAGKSYRFYDNREYQIIETKDIVIYRQQVVDPIETRSNAIRGFYFSTTPGGEIKSLSVENLINAFPENRKLHDLLNQNIRTKADSHYDSFQEMNQLNHLYQISKKTVAKAF